LLGLQGVNKVTITMKFGINDLDMHLIIRSSMLLAYDYSVQAIKSVCHVPWPSSPDSLFLSVPIEALLLMSYFTWIYGGLIEYLLFKIVDIF